MLAKRRLFFLSTKVMHFSITNDIIKLITKALFTHTNKFKPYTMFKIVWVGFLKIKKLIYILTKKISIFLKIFTLQDQITTSLNKINMQYSNSSIIKLILIILDFLLCLSQQKISYVWSQSYAILYFYIIHYPFSFLFAFNHLFFSCQYVIKNLCSRLLVVKA